MRRVKALHVLISLICITALYYRMKGRHGQSYLSNLLVGYIGADTECDKRLFGQLYRDSLLNTPIVLEASGLVSGFGFEGYTWKQHNNGFVELSVLYLKNRSTLNYNNTRVGNYLSYYLPFTLSSPPTGLIMK